MNFSILKKVLARAHARARARSEYSTTYAKKPWFLSFHQGWATPRSRLRLQTSTKATNSRVEVGNRNRITSKSKVGSRESTSDIQSRKSGVGSRFSTPRSRRLPTPNTTPKFRLLGVAHPCPFCIPHHNVEKWQSFSEQVVFFALYSPFTGLSQYRCGLKISDWNKLFFHLSLINYLPA